MFANIDSAGPDASQEKRMATAGTVIFELKLAVDIILAEDGKYYVDAATTTEGDAVHEWTEGPFETEAKARECLKWQYAIPLATALK
jgi:hypothetical protein